jgi:outer membrane receptor protein involved in Fe transport
MYIFRKFLILLLLLNGIQIFANEVKNPSDADTGIKGKVLDKSNKQALEYATVMVYNQADSSFVAGSISGVSGEFDIKLKPGKYYVTVQFLAYGSITINDVTVGRGKISRDLGELLISPDSALLDEFEVIAERSTVEMSLDKRVFNIGKDISSKAGNAIEVLENIPSVTVDIDGNVSLRGDEGVRILIDGKVSGLAGISSRNALRSIQADMIERIEIVTNPSVRYDAEGTSGIINIVLKKDRRFGFNGSIDASAGYPLQGGIGINTNYRFQKMNLFANYNINYRENVGGGTSYREFFGDIPLITEQDTERVRKDLSNTIRIGAEYFIDAKSSLAFSLMYRMSDQNNRSTVTYNDFRPEETLINQSQRIDDEKENDPNLQYSLDYRKQFKKKDQLFTASIQYFDNSEDAKSDISENVILRPGTIIPDPMFQQTVNAETQTNLQMQADYYHPFRGKAKLETGFKLQIREIGNDYEVREKDDNGDFIILDDFTNHFTYDEKIYAAYALFGNDAGRYSYQLGLRSEYSDIRTILLETNQDNRKTYPDFFPSAHFTYKLTESDNLQVSYSRRIRRPGFRQLNPFRTFTDNRNFWSGNPDLKPVYTNSFELGYLRYWKKASFNANTYYRRSTDVFQRIERVDDSTGISYTRPENFAKNDSYGLELIGMVSPYKWWNLNGSLNFFRSITEGEAYGVFYSTDNYTWTGRMTNRFNIKKGFDLQLSGNYMGKMNTPQGKRLPQWSVDMGASLDVLKNKGTLTLNVRDVFNTRSHAFETFGENFYSKVDFRWSSTTVTLNFNYRINQQKKRTPDRRQQTDGDEGMMEF